MRKKILDVILVLVGLIPAGAALLAVCLIVWHMKKAEEARSGSKGMIWTIVGLPLIIAITGLDLIDRLLCPAS